MVVKGLLPTRAYRDCRKVDGAYPSGAGRNREGHGPLMARLMPLLASLQRPSRQDSGIQLREASAGQFWVGAAGGTSGLGFVDARIRALLELRLNPQPVDWLVRISTFWFEVDSGISQDTYGRSGNAEW